MIYRPLSILEEISEEEQNKIKTAFEHITNNRYKDAEKLLFEINNKSSARATKAAVQYGFGVLNTIRPDDQSDGINNLEETINYFDRSAKLSEKPEAYLQLGNALYKKLNFVLEKTRTTPDRNNKLINLIDTALLSFKKARASPEYNGTSQLVEELEKTKRDLKNNLILSGQCP